MSRRVIVVLGLLALVIVTAFLTGRPPQDEDGPNGILALRRFLDRMGREVVESEDPPRQGTFFLPADFRGENETSRLLRWVRRGGKLVVAWPYSGVVERLSIDVVQGGPGSYTTILERPPECVTPETSGVTQVAIRGSDLRLRSQSPNPLSCFNDGDRSYTMRVPLGQGNVIVLGGMSPFINANLSRADNALFAHQVLSSNGPIVFGPAASADTRPRGVWAALPTAAKLVVAQLALALVVFAFVRGRRLGGPVPEVSMSPIPAGELVTARAELLRQARAAPFATDILRKSAARRLAKRIGMSAEADPEMLSRLVARNAEEFERLKRLFETAPPDSEERLLELAREIEEEVSRLEVRR